MSQTPPFRNFYGRRKGKHLRDAQEEYLAQDLAALTLSGVAMDENPARDPLDLEAIFGGREVWLEIGFGGGEHLVHQAAAHPERGFIGCEPYINGVAMLLGKLRAANIANLRLYCDDVRHLFDVLPDAALGRAFLLYPDPWPKARHHRRRFVTQGYLRPLARVLRAGSEFRIATDIPDYVRQALEEVPQAGFDLVAQSDTPWQDWLSTRYEQKALREGRAPHYLTFMRQV